MNAAGPLVRVKAAPRARAETAARARAPAIAFFAVFILFPRFAGPRSYFSRFAGSGRAVLARLFMNLYRNKKSASFIFLFYENKYENNA